MPADKLQWLHFFTHTGGLNTRYSPTSLPIFDATEMQNVENLINGGFRKMKGYSRYTQAPILASGTYLDGATDPTAASDPWTGAGDAAAYSTTSGIMTLIEGAGGQFIRYFNAEAGFTTGVDACCERRSRINSGYTASGVYVESLIVLDDGTKRFELVAVETVGVKKIGVLTSTADRTVIGNYTSLVTHDWMTSHHRYRVSFDGGAGNTVSVYVDDMTSAATTIGYSALPASTETSRVAFGSFVASTVITTATDYVAYKIGSTSLDVSPVTGIYDFIDEANTQQVLCTAGTKLYRFSTTTNDWVEITGGTAFTSGAKPHFVTFSDTTVSNNAIAIITTESRDTPQKWDGSTRANLGGTPPAGKFCAVYNERLFIANTSAEPSAVYFSALGDPEDRDDQSGTWDQTNDVFLVARHVYGDITGLIVVNSMLLIFSRKGIHRLQGWGKGSFILETVTSRNGCVAPNSIIRGPLGAEANEGVYFRDRDGWHWTNGNIGQVVRVSEKILPTVHGDILSTQVDNECSFLDPNRNLIGWSVTSSGTTNDYAYTLDYLQAGGKQEDGKLQEGWFPIGHGMRAAGTVRQDAGKDIVLFSDNNGVVHQLDSGDTYDFADIGAYRSTAWISCGAPHLFKGYRYIIVYSDASGAYDLDLDFAINYGDNYTVTKQMDLTPVGDLLGSTFIIGQSILGGINSISSKLPIDLIANSLKIRFGTTGGDQPFNVYGFSLGFEMMNDWFDGR